MNIEDFNRYALSIKQFSKESQKVQKGQLINTWADRQLPIGAYTTVMGTADSYEVFPPDGWIPARRPEDI